MKPKKEKSSSTRNRLPRKKTCTMCHQTLDASSFRKNATKKDGLQSQCIDCQREYRKWHYQQNRDKYIEKSNEWKGVFAAWWTEFKQTLSCANCGENHSACLEFHNEDREAETEISRLMHSGNGPQLMRVIKQCDVLCANCHRKHHYTAS